ncbi:patatin-like phospholipase family protein [Polynucleobacter sp. MG-5-Ahmo-C2]|jgi:predicted patatin/cPLA2 family phospholipase|uniref:patatin-like phospholipase family protein n=1 Tax=unclassified Polynucleobacter TaxID=2640945 RepID=UPI001BFD8F4A|nr:MULTISPECIES: patatin-like phospholipase family protein [unclassified Polynucleobacter]QWD71690.1 patatin-like phospholipase family protein [Polynucleobacter sp. UB-Raua-W9]QWD97776.1 patatin-like phospholipase family protein [Polynucleobacter sp. MG-5-Ahmo-C2]
MRLSSFAACIVVSLSLLGCSALERKSAVPAQSLSKAEIAGLPSVRYLISTQAGVDALVADATQVEAGRGKNAFQGDANYLALSGGGDDGAFGAGLLVGWSKQGSRPSFNLVTGISTGALIAPFAYLGKDYDPALKQVYTNINPQDIFINRGIISGIFSDGLADSTPLYQLIAKYVDANFLKKIAYEYNTNGRWLLIGTTNIDAGVPVAWNMGRIASVGTPEAIELFRRIMLASASIPGAFSPVMFDFLVDSQAFQEMHVDGGASTQVFLYPSAAVQRANELGLKRRSNRQAYIIRNSRLDPRWNETERRTLSVAGRAISQLIQTQGIGDLYRIYAMTKFDHVGFNLAYIGSDFNEPHQEEFDTKYMNALFQYGYEHGLKGYQWSKYPPGFNGAFDTDGEKMTLKKKPL